MINLNVNIIIWIIQTIHFKILMSYMMEMLKDINFIFTKITFIIKIKLFIADNLIINIIMIIPFGIFLNQQLVPYMKEILYLNLTLLIYP